MRHIQSYRADRNSVGGFTAPFSEEHLINGEDSKGQPRQKRLVL